MTDFLQIIRESIRDFFEFRQVLKGTIRQKIGHDEEHLHAAMNWLYESWKHGKGGSASHYSLLHGKWLPPFPETTGYIIPTVFDYAHLFEKPQFREMAVQLTHWLCKAQLDNGACMRGNYDEAKGKNEPVIFNSGQNLLGFIRAYTETGNEKFLGSAIRAADFLVSSTDEHGIWNQHLLRGLKHTINVRCSWALLLMNSVKSNPDYSRVAIANLDWTLNQQTESGWFHHGTSKPGGLPNTHFLSYTCEGLLESFLICGDKKYFEAAYKTARQLLKLFQERKMLFAFWDEQWNNHGKYFGLFNGKLICVTGNIQISIVWMMIYKITKDMQFLTAAFRMQDYIKATQNINTSRPQIRGGIKGSFPVYGNYSVFKYPNWAAKFFCDALMKKINMKENYSKEKVQDLQQ